MNNWLAFYNSKPVEFTAIPCLNTEQFFCDLEELMIKGYRLLAYTALNHQSTKEHLPLIAIVTHDIETSLYAATTLFSRNNPCPSFTQRFPIFNYFERQLYEDFDLKFLSHPFLKPVKYNIHSPLNKKITEYNFFKTDSNDMHEVGVGPIHAGVIEPGHFRFSCNGEQVHHLEIQLGYQHRDIVSLITQALQSKNYIQALCLAETIAGDTSIAHAMALCNNLEGLSHVVVADAIYYLRSLALEIERIAVHLGDLSAVSGDIAYAPCQAVFGALRTLVINTSLDLCGSRFGRGFIRYASPGNTFYSLQTAEKINQLMEKIRSDVLGASELFFAAESVLTRLDQVGVVTKRLAQQIGMVGPAARASGVALDVRIDHPWAPYNELSLEKITLKNGDVYSRTFMRFKEIIQSIDLSKTLIKQIQPQCNTLKSINMPTPNIKPNLFCVALIEGWRGEVLHFALTDEQGNIQEYYIRDPSFFNWQGLSLAMAQNQISDFPVCNKSFNLSYCGFDL